MPVFFPGRRREYLTDGTLTLGIVKVPSKRSADRALLQRSESAIWQLQKIMDF